MRLGKQSKKTGSGLRLSALDIAGENDQERRVRTKRAVTASAKGPGPRGWAGPGGGSTTVVQSAPEWRATSVQACGLWPFAAGRSAPTVGVPLGPSEVTGGMICADPMSWFTRQLITTPSMFVLGTPHVGKSTLVRRLLIGMCDQGVIPLVLGDLKPDYTRVIEALGGTVISLGAEHTHINPLDLMGTFGPIADLPGEVRGWALRQLIDQQVNIVQGLLDLTDPADPLTGDETGLLPAALHALQVDEHGAPRPGTAPTLRQVLQVFQDRHPAIRARLLDGGDDAEYTTATKRLQRRLLALCAGGRFGDLFDGPSTHIPLDRPVSYDLHDLEYAEPAKKAAAQLACWATGSATISLATRLADLGLRPRIHYFLVMDELWRMLRVSGHMVQRIDTITRINREMGLGQGMITHTMNDLELETEAQSAIARGFVERSAMLFLGGLAPREFGNLEQVVSLSSKERARLTDWGEKGSLDTVSAAAGPRGRGKFLLKLGKQPGLPFRLLLTERERWISDTNRRWETLAVPGAGEGQR